MGACSLRSFAVVAPPLVHSTAGGSCSRGLLSVPPHWAAPHRAAPSVDFASMGLLSHMASQQQQERRDPGLRSNPVYLDFPSTLVHFPSPSAWLTLRALMRLSGGSFLADLSSALVVTPWMKTLTMMTVELLVEMPVASPGAGATAWGGCGLHSFAALWVPVVSPSTPPPSGGQWTRGATRPEVSPAVPATCSSPWR